MNITEAVDMWNGNLSQFCRDTEMSYSTALKWHTEKKDLSPKNTILVLGAAMLKGKLTVNQAQRKLYKSN